MKKTSTLLAFILSILMIFQPLSPALAEDTDIPGLDQHFTFYDEIPTMLIGEPESGKILLEKGIDQSYPIASMSKIMTYYLIKEAITNGEIATTDIVTISESAAYYNNWESSNYGLEVGMEKSVADLLTALMVVSGNDAAVALAEHLSGSEEAFVQRMNQKAEELGLYESSFTNASGYTALDGTMNSMSARDLFELTSLVIKEYPETLDYVHIRVIEERERGYVVDSTIKRYMDGIPGMLGLKTGTTNEAGYCFTGVFDLAQTNANADFDVITIVIGAEDSDQRWRTTKELVDFAAGSFSEQELVDANIPVTRYDMPTANEGSVVLYPAESFTTITYANTIPDIRYEIYENVKAPTEAQQVFGSIYIYHNEQPIKKIDIVAHSETTAASWSVRLQRAFESFFGFLVQLFQ